MDHSTDKRLKKILELWHADPHLTQRNAALRMNMSQSAVCQYLNNKIPLNLPIIIKFAKLFNTSPVEIDSSLKF